jgi:prepilin peptidase CpaA
MPTIQIVLFLLLTICLAISLVTDLRSRLIYDVVTIPTFVVGLLVRLGYGWWSHGEVMGSLMDPLSLSSGLVAAFAGAMPFFLVSWQSDGNAFGMGDVKLLAAIGAMLGWQELIPAVWYTALSGGLQAIVMMTIKGQLLRTFGRTFKMVASWLRIRQLTDEEEAEPSEMLPYGVAIVTGTLFSMLLEVFHAHSASTAG